LILEIDVSDDEQQLEFLASLTGVRRYADPFVNVLCFILRSFQQSTHSDHFMKNALGFLPKILLSALLLASISSAAEPAIQDGNERIVFIGDSITGQGGGWNGTGYVFKMREALSAVYPAAKHNLVPLGGSGMGIGAWLNLAKDAEKQKRDLDVKGIEVASALSQPADALVLMLGMNDVLAPYVSDTEASLDQWQANYRELIKLLSTRLKPRVIALATITPQTEDPESPKNRVMARMNQRIIELAAELKACVLPTNATYWEVLAQGRKIQSDFSLAGDRIHPNAIGHMAVAMAMAKGLGSEKAAAWLSENRVAKSLASLKPNAALSTPPPWLASSGLILRAWQDKPADADLASSPIDLAIERGEDFTQKPAREGGTPLEWRTFQSSVNLSDGANPGSVDFAGITFFQNFEAGYGARWIRSDAARRLKLNLSTSGIGSTIYLTVWLNGQRIYSDLISKEPQRQAAREVELRAGWNVLIFKSFHRAWQWQQTINFTELDGSLPKDLEYRSAAPR
jgi:lysophospholipase L1-like esterase